MVCVVHFFLFFFLQTEIVYGIILDILDITCVQNLPATFLGDDALSTRVYKTSHPSPKNADSTSVSVCPLVQQVDGLRAKTSYFMFS